MAIMNNRFKKISELPDFIFDTSVKDLHKHIDNLSVFLIEGQKKPPIFVSVLLHGNEHSGLKAIQSVIKESRDSKKILPRAIILLIGNVKAGAKNIRALDDGYDLNRIWLEGYEASFTERINEITQLIEANKIFLSIDIHNTSGRNIHYACVPELDLPHLQLARLFSRVVVYVKKPASTLMNRMSKFAPSVTLECGQSNEVHGVEHAIEFLHACLNLSKLPEKEIPKNEITLLKTLAIIYVAKDTNFCFANDPKESNADLILRDDLDALNFSQVEPGEILGRCQDPDCIRLEYLDKNNTVNSNIEFKDGQIVLAKKTFFAMLSTDIDVIKKDCLGYLMVEVEN